MGGCSRTELNTGPRAVVDLGRLAQAFNAPQPCLPPDRALFGSCCWASARLAEPDPPRGGLERSLPISRSFAAGLFRVALWGIALVSAFSSSSAAGWPEARSRRAVAVRPIERPSGRDDHRPRSPRHRASDPTRPRAPRPRPTARRASARSHPLSLSAVPDQPLDAGDAPLLKSPSSTASLAAAPSPPLARRAPYGGGRGLSYIALVGPRHLPPA